MYDAIDLATIEIFADRLVVTWDAGIGTRVAPVHFAHLTLGMEDGLLIVAWPGGMGSYPTLPDWPDKHSRTEADYRARDIAVTAAVEHAAEMRADIMDAWQAWAVATGLWVAE